MTRRRKVKGDEQELWSRVTHTVAPLHAERLIQPPTIPPEEKTPGTSPKHPKAKMPDYTPPVSVSSKPEGSKPGLDRPAYKRLSKGKVSIDARIDLHDMTQSVAHHRLANFLADARASGMRHVLVITGKGTSSGGQGVLRRMVPLWLGTEPMKHHVSGFSNAARHHGGEGALYIRLRRA